MEVLNVLHKSAFQFYQLNNQLMLLAKANAKNTRSIAWNVSALSSTRKESLAKKKESEITDSTVKSNEESHNKTCQTNIINSKTNAPDSLNKTKQSALSWGSMTSEKDLYEQQGLMNFSSLLPPFLTQY